MAFNREAHLPIDASVRMPDSVAAAAAAADALLAANVPGAPSAGPTPIGPAPPPAGTVTPLVAPQPQQPQPVVHGQVIPPQGDVDPPRSQPGTPEASWEQRARSERGRREAVDRQLQGLQGQVNDLMRQLEQARSGAPQAPVGGAPGTPIALDPNQIFTAEERAQYEKTWGAEMTQFVLDAAAKIAGRAAGTVTAQVGQQIQSSQEEQWRLANQAMMTSLDSLLPDGNGQAGWRIVNDDPAFISWLQQPDGFSKLNKLQVLQTAWAANDTQTAYKIFAAYMTGMQPLPGGQPDPGSTPQAPHFGAPPASNRLSLNGLAAPGPTRANGAGAPAAPEVNQYRVSEVSQFFSDLGRGVYNDTVDRQRWAKSIEADIYAAQREGRVIPG